METERWLLRLGGFLWIKPWINALILHIYLFTVVSVPVEAQRGDSGDCCFYRDSFIERHFPSCINSAALHRSLRAMMWHWSLAQVCAADRFWGRWQDLHYVQEGDSFLCSENTFKHLSQKQLPYHLQPRTACCSHRASSSFHSPLSHTHTRAHTLQRMMTR